MESVNLRKMRFFTYNLPLFHLFFWQFDRKFVLLPSSFDTAPVVSGVALHYQRKIQ